MLIPITLNLSKFKTKLLKNSETDGANGITLSLEHLSNFWGSVEMPLITWKVELKPKWTKHCVLSAAGVDNTAANLDNIIFTVKDTKLYVPVATWLARDNEKLSKLLSKRFEISVYWNEHKTKRDDKNTTNKFRHFLEFNFVGVNRSSTLIYPNWHKNSKRSETRKYYLPKVIIKNCNVIVNGKKNFYEQAIDSDINRYKKNRKLTPGRSVNYTTRWRLHDWMFIRLWIH